MNTPFPEKPSVPPGPAAFPALLDEYRALIGAAVTRYGADLQATDREDLRQSALLAFYRAALNYDVAQSEVEFGLFAKICVENALISHLRRLRRPGFAGVGRRNRGRFPVRRRARTAVRHAYRLGPGIGER